MSTVYFYVFKYYIVIRYRNFIKNIFLKIIAIQICQISASKISFIPEKCDKKGFMNYDSIVHQAV